MDNFTKFVEATPLANQEATSAARALVETVIVRYGAPLQILTDQGKILTVVISETLSVVGNR